MSFSTKRNLIRVWGVPAVTALATILVAAASEMDRGWERLRSLPADRRLKLVETLKKFDLVYTPKQRQDLRELDRRINELPAAERSYYFSVLHGYHNWLNQLPENKQSDLSDKPPGERMAVVSKLIADYPIPQATTSRFMQVADLGEYSPLELAAVYRIWQAMPPAQRERIERLDAVPKRQDALFRFADKNRLPREIKPPELDESAGMAKVEEFLRSARRPMVLFPQLKKILETAGPRSETVRRMTINYYFVANPPHAVTPERLDDFMAAFPPWLRTTFDPFPPDEARRRLSIVYRLVYPHPAEMKAGERPPPTRAAPGPIPNQPRRRQVRPASRPPLQGPPLSEARPRSWDESCARTKTCTGCGGPSRRRSVAVDGSSRTRWSGRS